MTAIRVSSQAEQTDFDLGEHARINRLLPDSLPLFIEAEGKALNDLGSFLTWLKENRTTLDGLIVAHGGIVLRDFPITTTEDFEQVMDCFPRYDMGYVGGASPRRLVGKKALESTYIASHYKIGIHQEMAYTRDFPPRIMFFARKVAARGGETIIADMRRITKSLPKAVAEKLDRLGIMSVRNYAGTDADPARASLSPDFVSWTTSFGTEDKTEAERIIALIGREAHWNANGTLTTVARFPAYTVHPRTGEKIYRNTLHAEMNPFDGDLSDDLQAMREGHFKLSGNYFGDGSRPSEDEVVALSALVDAATIEWVWRDGDVMILDNLLVGHGRNPFEGERETQVALLA